MGASRTALRLLARLRAPAASAEPLTGAATDPILAGGRVRTGRGRQGGFRCRRRLLPVTAARPRCFCCRLRPCPDSCHPSSQPAAGSRRPAACQRQQCGSRSGGPGHRSGSGSTAVAGTGALRGGARSRQRLPPARRCRGAAPRLAGLAGQLVGRPEGSRARLAAGCARGPPSGSGICLCPALPVPLIWLRAHPGGHGER